MKVIDIAFTIIPVSSLKIGRSFYEGVLGLKVSKSYLSGEDAGMVEYDIGPGTLAIGSGSPMFKPSPEGTSISLEVEDFQVAVADLKAANATFSLEPYESPVCFMAVVSDPDGNKVMLHKRKG